MNHDEQLSRLKQIVEKHKDSLCKKRNVVGVGIGLKYTNCQPTDEEALLVFVKKKVNRDDLRNQDCIPSIINGIKTDVVGRIGQIQALPIMITAQAVNNRAERPLRAGISIGHIYVTAGTLGGFFIDKNNDIVILSNQHVMAGERTRGPYGPAPQRGNLILQPGPFDGGKTSNAIGKLKKWVTLRKRNNTEDSATARINPSGVINEVKGLGKIKGFGKISIGQDVQKVGRSTGHTIGKIISVSATVCVEYGPRLIRCFDDCIITTNMSEGGDSGSILLDMNMNAVGLLFAGSDTVTIYNPIKYPIKTYGLKLWQ